MSSKSTLVRLLGAFCKAAVLTAVLTSASAQAPVTMTPRKSGPVDLADLQLLLGDGLYFQHFDFSADDAFCLSLGYTVDGTVDDTADGIVDGHPVSEQRGGRVGRLCHTAGEHRLLVVLRSASLGERGPWRLHFGLHERDTAAGAAFSSDDGVLPDGQVRSWSVQMPREALMFEQDVTLLRWTVEQHIAFRLNGGPIVSRSELEISAHVEANPSGGISAGPDRSSSD